MSSFCCRHLFFILLATIIMQDCALAEDRTIRNFVTELSQLGSRQTGTDGYEKAADLIIEHFQALGLDPQIHRYPVPVRQASRAEMHLGGKTVTLHPFFYNAITPQSIDGSIEAPLHYAADGSMAAIDGKPINNSIILLEFDSGINWQQLASLGAKAVIFIDRGNVKGKQFFKEKEELTPIQFPMFWMEEQEALALFGKLEMSVMSNRKLLMLSKGRLYS